MIPKEILKNIRRIQITTSRMVSDVFAGQYQSVFKGRGMEFDEVREYQPGMKSALLTGMSPPG